MVGRMRNAMLYLGLVDDDEGAYEEHESYDEPEPMRAQRAPRVTAVRAPERPVERLHERTAVTAVSFDEEDRMPQRAPADQLARITTLHPRTYNDARTIGEQFRAGVPVIMDLTDMDDADAKRLVDFAAGLTFGLRGRIEKVTRSVFLLSPEGIAVQLDDAAGVVEGGFYNQS